VAVTRGKGRVLVFTDSTIWSNFFMFIRGKPELALSSVAWLMHTNRLAWLRPLLAAGALVVALALLLAIRGKLRSGLPLVLALAGALSFAATARLLDGWVARHSAPPAPRKTLPLVAFERGRTAYAVPDVADIPDKSPRSFHTFYVWTQRVGWMPTTRLFENCFDGVGTVVILNPREHFSPAEIQGVQKFVQDGGQLLVMDSAHAHHSTANTLLEPFGLQFDYAAVESVGVRDAARGDTLALLMHAGAVRGGEPRILLPDGRAALATASPGRGRLVAMCASDNFNDASLGTTSEVPTPEQLALYRIEYRIFAEWLRLEDSRSAGVR
jgi:hypothetical protein